MPTTASATMSASKVTAPDEAATDASRRTPRTARRVDTTRSGLTSAPSPVTWSSYDSPGGSAVSGRTSAGVGSTSLSAPLRGSCMPSSSGVPVAGRARSGISSTWPHPLPQAARGEASGSTRGASSLALTTGVGSSSHSSTLSDPLEFAWTTGCGCTSAAGGTCSGAASSSSCALPVGGRWSGHAPSSPEPSQSATEAPRTLAGCSAATATAIRGADVDDGMLSRSSALMLRARSSGSSIALQLPAQDAATPTRRAGSSFV
eukprot:scaffold122832_cov30-Tisochrysis_lutea.AAC.2